MYFDHEMLRDSVDCGNCLWVQFCTGKVYTLLLSDHIFVNLCADEALNLLAIVYLIVV